MRFADRTRAVQLRPDAANDTLDATPRGGIRWLKTRRQAGTTARSPAFRHPAQGSYDQPMSGGIYLVRGDDELVEMRETPYEAEDVLQALIAKFPSLLSGDRDRR